MAKDQRNVEAITPMEVDFATVIFYKQKNNFKEAD